MKLLDFSLHLKHHKVDFGAISYDFSYLVPHECFQRRMNDILAGEDGVLCHMDDILIFRKTQDDTRLHSNLKKIKTEGVTLNKDKCEFNKSQLHFLGHIINKHGISLDPDKTAGILQMEKRKTLTELRRFMGMVNQ